MGRVGGQGWWAGLVAGLVASLLFGSRLGRLGAPCEQSNTWMCVPGLVLCGGGCRLLLLLLLLLLAAAAHASEVKHLKYILEVIWVLGQIL